ncbi:hypothetical protein HMPREF1505_0573 [Prevotella sp. ICM33]|nr:hypothetical protein HMPREF1505_0573 [Prevotella sp. ICM33]
MSNTLRNLAVVLIVFLFLYAAKHFWGGDIKVSKLFGVSDLFSVDSVEVADDYDAIYPMKHKGRICFFYVTNRRYDYGLNDDKTLVDGHYYGFVDAQTGQVLADKLLISDDESKRVDMTSINELKIWHLYQADKWLCLIPKQFIYEINPQTLTMNNISKTIFANKEAMSSGISSVDFISRTSNFFDFSLEGDEGLEISNNLAEVYYYFPATDHLYTEEAYNYAKELPSSELKGEMRDSVLYILESKKSNASSSKESQNRLTRIQFTYHLGNPKYLSNPSNKKYDFVAKDIQVVSSQQISDWFTGFDANIILQDSTYILIWYKSNISENAPAVLQLRNTNGKILWTRSLDCPIKIGGVLRDNQKIWFRATRENTDRYDDEYIMSLTLKGGNIKYEYKFANSHNVRKQ